MKKFWISLLSVVLALFVVVIGYISYVFIEYDRLGDETLAVNNASGTENAEIGREYTLLSMNTGFAAYSESFDFFMDGGTHSRAFSKEEVYKNLGGMREIFSREDPDFLFLQEVDEKADRSFKVNEREYHLAAFASYANSYAVNFHSAYLFYPLTRPHGKSKSGILTLSRYRMTSAERKSVPVDSGFTKFFDLDRCYMTSRIPAGEKELVLFNLHLSAYSKDGSINRRQLTVLYEEMEKERAAGNYVVAAGDFNQDLLKNSADVFGIPVPEGVTWCAPFDDSALPQGFSLLAPTGEGEDVPSCRNCDTGYKKGETFVLTVDGFIVSDNVDVVSCKVLDEGFLYSDHNPVKLTFSLNAD